MPFGIYFLPCGDTQVETGASHLRCGLPAHRAQGQVSC